MTLAAASGVALDSYVDPEGDFVMGCILCTSALLPYFRAFYRKDTVGSVQSGREEWVFEYGNPLLATTPPNGTGAYTASITKADGTTLPAISLAAHYWISRWRWQSVERPVRHSVTDFTSAHILPLYNPSAFNLPPAPTVPAYLPMRYAGLTPDENQGGVSPDIGYVTGYNIDYLYGRTAAEGSFRNQAEASGTLMWHWRDPNTNAPLSYVTYPHAGRLSGSSPRVLFPAVRGNTPDAGHFPSTVYAPFLLTGDPYYLEELQFMAIYFLGEGPGSLPPQTRYALQGRYYAWPLRAVAQTIMAMRWSGNSGTVPNWLLPMSEFVTLLEAGRQAGLTRVNNLTDPFFSVFHTWFNDGQFNADNPVNCKNSDFMHPYVTIVLSAIYDYGAHNAYTPFANWLSVGQWSVYNDIQRTNGTSGWPRQFAIPYQQDLMKYSVLAEAMTAGQTTIKMLYRSTYVGGDTIRVDNETMLLGSSADNVNWTVTRGTGGTTAVAHALSPNFPYGQTWFNPVYNPKLLNWPDSATLSATRHCASWSGFISGTTLTVTYWQSSPNNAISVLGSAYPISGPGVTPGTYIISQSSGVTGKEGVYVLSASASVPEASFTASITRFGTEPANQATMTVTAMDPGSPLIQQGSFFRIRGSGVPAGLYVLKPGTGVGGIGTYFVNTILTVPSGPMTASVAWFTQVGWALPGTGTWSAVTDFGYQISEMAALAIAKRSTMTATDLDACYTYCLGQIQTYMTLAKSGNHSGWTMVPS